MKRLGLFLSVGFLFAVCGAAVGQQFRISEYDGETLTIEYPPSFDGAYLFVGSSSNLTSNVVWEAVDYTQVELVLGETVYYTPPATNTSGSSTNEAVVPYEITPEYIEAVSNGEIENDSWTAGSVWDATTDGVKGFFRIFGLSFVDTDGDGVDNVSEYGAGTDPNVPDSPPVTLPPDDGDPQTVPGSVASAPGDWNAPPQSDYRAPVGWHGAINVRILAMDGTNGTFTASSTTNELGAWIESMCGTWTAPEGDDTYPTVDGGRFFQTETNGFTWVGKENIYALAFHPHDGSEQFVNHLVKSDAADPAGLALLPDSTPVLVNASNPWTTEKIEACLPHLVTVPCRLQKLDGGAFDPSDTTAMAQGESQTNFDPLEPVDEIQNAICYIQLTWSYIYPGWGNPSGVHGYSRNRKFTFLDNLAQLGFGSTTHRGYVGLTPPYDWKNTGIWEKYSLQTSLPSNLLAGAISKTFTRTDGGNAWLFAEDTNYGIQRTAPSLYDLPPYHPPNFAMHLSGFLPYAGEVLSTLSPPPMSAAATLVMDMDRDGTIGTNDINRVDESRPFRFWVNEDADDLNGTKYALPAGYSPVPVEFYLKDDLYADIPGQYTDVSGASLNSIGTLNDLEDFFPAMVDWPVGVVSNAVVKLFSNVKLGIVDAALDPADSDQYLTDLATANAVLAKSVHFIDPANSGTKFTVPGASLDKAFLVEVHEEKTNAQIWVEFEEPGGPTYTFTNHFAFTPVEKMFRFKNLREGDYGAAPDRLGEPENRPDELCNDANCYYIHGFNVSEPRARGSQSAMFKRLWWSGSNARFYGICWDGTPLGEESVVFGRNCHYHNAVVNAFATAPQLATFLDAQAVGGRQNIVMAHSLGNVVAGSAICDHGADVAQCYLLNAAVAKEAYGDSAPNDDMTPDGNFIYNQNEGMFSLLGHDWREYPHETWASEWYQLFTNDVNDVRGKLTWRHRFADIQTHVDAFNFYSSTEDVLRIDTGYTALISGFFDGGFHVYSFQLQEVYKGKDSSLADKAGGASDPYTGWGFTTESDTHIYSTPLLDIQFWPTHPSYHRDQLGTNDLATRAAFREILKTDPLFVPNPPELFGTGGDTFAGSTVATCGFTFNYDLPDATVDIAAVPIRDYLLAKAFPARTGALGSRLNTKWHLTDGNFNMADKYIKPGQWIRPDTYNETLEWRHSDMRDAAYVYVHKFFDKLTAKEEAP